MRFFCIRGYARAGVPGLLLLLLALGGLALAAGVLTCPKCGYEYTEGQVACAHCRALLPEPDSKGAAAEATTIPGPEEEAIPPSPRAVARPAAQQEYGQARTAYGNGEYALAVLHARNTLALQALLEAEDTPSRAELKRHLTLFRAALKSTSLRCFACNGSGNRTQPVLTMEKEVRVRRVPGQVCPVCGGKGSLPGGLSDTELTRALAAAGRVFRSTHEQQGSLRVDEVWVPAALEGDLHVLETASLLSAWASVCSECLGDGLKTCPRCKGLGQQKCTNKKCVMGRERCPACEGTGKERADVEGRQLTRNCTTCNGTGIATCSVCGGKAALPCETCTARGTLLCSVCEGSGEPARCGKCLGHGTTPCTRCKGTGEYRGAICPLCRGEKVALCKTCRGTGHAKR